MTQRQFMIKTVAACALTLAMVGCASPPPPGSSQAIETNAFSVKLRTVVHKVGFFSRSDKITTAEDESLRHFIDGVKPADRMSVRFETSGALAKIRIAEVAKAIEGYGFTDALFRTDRGPVDAVLVIVGREMIAPNSCLDSEAEGSERSVRPSGCLNDRALYNMVEAKDDLLRGRDMGQAPASRAAALARLANADEHQSTTPPSNVDSVERQSLISHMIDRLTD